MCYIDSRSVVPDKVTFNLGISASTQGHHPEEQMFDDSYKQEKHYVWLIFLIEPKPN